MGNERTISVRSWLAALADETQAFRVERFVSAVPHLRENSTGDYIATLAPRTGRERIRLLIEAKTRLTPREALAVCAHLRHIHATKGRFTAVVIACPYVSPRVAEICSEHGIGYLDQAGNCDIRADGLVVHVEGRSNVVPDTRPLSNAFARKASRVARLLLCQPGRTWRVQDLSIEGGISLGLASKAKNALTEQGYVEERGRGVALRDARALLDSWTAAYRPAERRSPLYVMAEPTDIEQVAAEWCRRHDVTYGLAEFSGAWRLAPMVRYNQASLCIYETATREILPHLTKEVDAKHAATGSNLVVVSTSDESVFFDRREMDGLQVLSPVQLYLELRSRRGRGREAADELLQRVLEPSFQRAKVTG